MCKYIRTAVLIVFALAYAIASFGQQVTAGATVTTSGTIDNASDELTLSIPSGRGYGTLGISAVGTWSGTIAIQCAAGTSNIGDAPVALTLTPRNSSTTSTSFTSNNQWSASVGGCQRVRAVPTAWTSGSAIVTLVAAAVGGSGGGGGAGGSFDGVLLDAPGGDPVTDTANDAINVNVVAGAAGTATSDADDASIATGQTNSNVNALAMAYDGSVWRRLTFGTAGSPSAQVHSVQGVGGMTPLQVQSNTANLATEATLGGVLTSANFAAAFGTAGTADTQVVSVQGIASMTPILVSPSSGTFSQDSTFGTSTYTETTTTGPAIGAVRNDSLDALVNTTNEIGPIATTAEGAVWTSPAATAAPTAGCTPNSILSANTVNETAIKASGGNLYHLNVTNIGANEVFFKLYNDTTANIDETDTPTLRYVIPGNAAGAGNSVNMPPMGIAFSTAITFRITTGAADNDTGAIAANEVLVSYCYK